MVLAMNFKSQEDIDKYYGRKMPDRSELLAQGYKLHHFACHRGYVSRKFPGGIVVPYQGWFGDGYKIYIPRYDSSQYCTVAYWIKEKEL